MNCDWIEGKVKRMNVFVILFQLIFIFLFIGWQNPETDSWKEFQKTTEGLYHYLEASTIQNFSCLFSTDTYMNFVNSLGDSSYLYPLKLIWLREGKIYYVLQPSDRLNDPEQRAQLLEKVQLTKNQFHGFYLDWLNFLIVSPLVDIPPSAQVNFEGDTVDVRYTNEEEGAKVSVRKVFLKSGRLLWVEVESASEKVVNYPVYREIEGKWLCFGWDSQIYVDQRISSGLSTRLELSKFQNVWMPYRADLVVQTADKPGQKFYSIIFLKDYNFNLSLQELPLPSSRTDSSKVNR